MAKVNTTLLSLNLDWPSGSPRSSEHRKIIKQKLRDNAVLRSVTVPMLLSSSVFLQDSEILEEMKNLVIGYL